MKIIMSASNFDAIMKACKNVVSKDDFKPMMKCIELKSDGSSCRATAVCNTSTISVTVPIHKESDAGTTVIPVMKEAGKRADWVTIEDNDKEVTVKIGCETSTYGKFEGEFYRIDRVYPESDPEAEAYFYTDVIVDILKGLPKKTPVKISMHQHSIVIESDPIQPIKIKGIASGIRPRTEW